MGLFGTMMVVAVVLKVFAEGCGMGVMLGDTACEWQWMGWPRYSHMEKAIRV